MFLHRGTHVCFFFFQAEDGIRDVAVTGVQTCALPILRNGPVISVTVAAGRLEIRIAEAIALTAPDERAPSQDAQPLPCKQIGRASCRERGKISVVAVSLKKKKKKKKDNRCSETIERWM